MTNRDWVFLGLLAVGVYWVWAQSQITPVASTPIAPGTPGPSGNFMQLAPGLPSGAPYINQALGLDANGNPVPIATLPAYGFDVGYGDLAPAVTPLGGIDAALADPVGDGFSVSADGLLPSYQTVPLYSQG